MESKLPKFSSCPTCGGPAEQLTSSRDADNGTFYRFVPDTDDRIDFEKELLQRRIAGAERRINELRRKLSDRDE